MKNENCEKRSGWKPLEPAGRMPDLLRLFLPFCILHFAFCICLGQTRSALMVTNETGRLAGPTNFFAANSNLLNQAVNTNGFGGGGGAAFGGNPHWFFTNGAGQIDLQLSLSNFFNALQIGSVNLTNWSALATNVLQTEISAATNGLNVGQYLAANGGAGNANTLTNPAVQGGLYFPIGGFDWIGEAMGNVFDLLDTNGNIALQITNNHQGANLYADLTIANNLFLAGNNPGIWNHGTAQWQGSLNIVGALSGNGSGLTFPTPVNGFNFYGAVNPSNSVVVVYGDSTAVGLSSYWLDQGWFTNLGAILKYGVNGSTLAQAKTAFEGNGLATYGYSQAGSNVVFLLKSMENDVAGDPVAEITTLSNLLVEVVSSNALPVVYTIMPRTNPDFAATEAFIRQVNYYIRHEPLIWRVVDSEAMIQNNYDPNNTVDGTHPSASRYQMMANAAAQQIDAKVKVTPPDLFVGVEGTNLLGTVPNADGSFTTLWTGNTNGLSITNGLIINKGLAADAVLPAIQINGGGYWSDGLETGYAIDWLSPGTTNYFLRLVGALGVDNMNRGDFVVRMQPDGGGYGSFDALRLDHFANLGIAGNGTFTNGVIFPVNTLTMATVTNTFTNGSAWVGMINGSLISLTMSNNIVTSNTLSCLSGNGSGLTNAWGNGYMAATNTTIAGGGWLPVYDGAGNYYLTNTISAWVLNLYVQTAAYLSSATVTNTLNLLGPLQFSGTNAAVGQVLTATAGGYATFQPASGGGTNFVSSFAPWLWETNSAGQIDVSAAASNFLSGLNITAGNNGILSNLIVAFGGTSTGNGYMVTNYLGKLGLTPAVPGGGSAPTFNSSVFASLGGATNLAPAATPGATGTNLSVNGLTNVGVETIANATVPATQSSFVFQGVTYNAIHIDGARAYTGLTNGIIWWEGNPTNHHFWQTNFLSTATNNAGIVYSNWPPGLGFTNTFVGDAYLRGGVTSNATFTLAYKTMVYGSTYGGSLQSHGAAVAGATPYNIHGGLAAPAWLMNSVGVALAVTTPDTNVMAGLIQVEWLMQQYP
jgi:hypothetical protein